VTRLTTAQYIESLVAPVKPRKKSAQPEDAFHRDVARYLTAVIAQPGIASPKHVIWFSIEGRAKRSLREGAANRARGVISGVPDIVILHQVRTFFIELKSPVGRVSHVQETFHHELARNGIPVLVARGLDAIMRALDTWEIPHL
jgi:hypothetical protein